MNIGDFQMPDWNRYSGEPKFFLVFNKANGNIVHATWNEDEALKYLKKGYYDYQWFYFEEDSYGNHRKKL